MSRLEVHYFFKQNSGTVIPTKGVVAAEDGWEGKAGRAKRFRSVNRIRCGKPKQPVLVKTALTGPIVGTNDVDEMFRPELAG